MIDSKEIIRLSLMKAKIADLAELGLGLAEIKAKIHNQFGEKPFDMIIQGPNLRERAGVMYKSLNHVLQLELDQLKNTLELRRRLLRDCYLLGIKPDEIESSVPTLDMSKLSSILASYRVPDDELNGKTKTTPPEQAPTEQPPSTP